MLTDAGGRASVFIIALLGAMPPAVCKSLSVSEAMSLYSHFAAKLMNVKLAL